MNVFESMIESKNEDIMKEDKNYCIMVSGDGSTIKFWICSMQQLIIFIAVLTCTIYYNLQVKWEHVITKCNPPLPELKTHELPVFFKNIF